MLIFISILIGSILLARKEPLKETEVVKQNSTPAIQTTPIPTKIDINTADISLVMQLPGIGPGLAKEIIRHRPYSNMNDLLKVPGIGEKRLSRIKDMIDLPDVQVPDGQGRSLTIQPDVRADVIGSNILLDINKVTIEELSAIPGIGPVLAQAIIDYREKNDGFNSLEELMHVPRIGQKTYEKLKGYLYVESVPETETSKMVKAGPRPLYDSRVDPKAKCPCCGKQLWEKGKRKKEYIRCPHCLKLLNE